MAEDDERPARARPLTPSKLKAMAHPLRVQLYELLLNDGPSTASDLGRTVGESSGTTSYHLRRLAAVGLIEEDPDRGTARDRWWRPTEGGWSLDRHLTEAPETRVDAQMVVDEVLRVREERLHRWQRERGLWPTAWQDAASLAVSRITMSPADAAALSDELLAVVRRYHDRQPEQGTPGTARVVVQTDVFPTGDPPDEGAGPGAEAPSDRTD